MKNRNVSILIILTVLLCVSGCKRVEEDDKLIALESVNTGEYRIAIPFEASDTRETHVQFNRSSYDINAVGEGLLYYSTEYFSPEKYYLQEGQILSRNTLQAGLIYGDKEGLLGSKSTTNPYGLNPENGMIIPIANGKTITAKAGSGGTIPVIDVFEVNFISDLEKDADIKGISLAIVLNSTVLDKDGKVHTIEDEYLKVYGEEAGRNLAAYLKQQPGISSKTPIVVALFKAESSDLSLPGTYIAVGHGNGNVDRFEDVNEAWMMIPSSSATQADSTLVSQFNAIKQELYDFLPNNTEIIGKGFFKDSRISKLQLSVVLQAKTYTEKMGAVQYMNELLATFTNTDMEITVQIKVGDTVFAMLKRAKGSKTTEVITY